MGSSLQMPQGRALAHLGTHAVIVMVAHTSKRKFAYWWTAPRSPVLRVLVAPLLLGTALIGLLAVLV
jgi:hypothetical protein